MQLNLPVAVILLVAHLGGAAAAAACCWSQWWWRRRLCYTNLNHITADCAKVLGDMSQAPAAVLGSSTSSAGGGALEVG